MLTDKQWGLVEDVIQEEVDGPKDALSKAICHLAKEREACQLDREELEAIESFCQWHTREHRKPTKPEITLMFEEDGDGQDSVYGQVMALYDEVDGFAADQIKARQCDRRRLRRILDVAKHWKFEGKYWYDETLRTIDAWKVGRQRLRRVLALHRESRDAADEIIELVKAERDELRLQLKAVTDCIIYYAPSDFAILRYDSPAEALGALLGDKENEGETAT